MLLQLQTVPCLQYCSSQFSSDFQLLQHLLIPHLMYSTGQLIFEKKNFYFAFHYTSSSICNCGLLLFLLQILRNLQLPLQNPVGQYISSFLISQQENLKNIFNLSQVIAQPTAILQLQTFLLVYTFSDVVPPHLKKIQLHIPSLVLVLNISPYI